MIIYGEYRLPLTNHLLVYYSIIGVTIIRIKRNFSLFLDIAKIDQDQNNQQKTCEPYRFRYSPQAFTNLPWCLSPSMYDQV